MTPITDDERAGIDATVWLGVALFFVVGDAVTTYGGFAVGAAEAHPVAATALTTAGFAAMVACKVVVVGVAFAFYRRARAYRWAVPAALAAAGILIVAWNLAVVAVLLIR